MIGSHTDLSTKSTLRVGMPRNGSNTPLHRERTMREKMKTPRQKINWASPWRIAGMVLIVLGVLQILGALTVFILSLIPPSGLRIP